MRPGRRCADGWNRMTEARNEVLADVLRRIDRPAIAVSGGVDSMTLAAFAHELLPAVTMVHAISPAVPESATSRVKQFAAERGWGLRLVDAREFEDARYLANPANRCFFCKTNLYGTMARVAGGTLVSGTNLDDLSDWRPGLQAAKDYAVRHPFVAARFTKSDVRALAARLDLGEIAELPASPCLSSRIETGLMIESAMLRRVDAVESHVRAAFGVATVRCRRRAGGFVLELDPATLAAMGEGQREAMAADISAIAGERVALEPYRRGSAFLRGVQ